MAMSEAAVRVPEAAHRLNMDGPDVYLLIERGELRAGKGSDGLVYVPEDAIEDYRRRQAESSRKEALDRATRTLKAGGGPPKRQPPA
jgi:hypothetical protein